MKEKEEPINSGSGPGSEPDQSEEPSEEEEPPHHKLKRKYLRDFKNPYYKPVTNPYVVPSPVISTPSEQKEPEDVPSSSSDTNQEPTHPDPLKKSPPKESSNQNTNQSKTKKVRAEKKQHTKEPKNDSITAEDQLNSDPGKSKKKSQDGSSIKKKYGSNKMDSKAPKYEIYSPSLNQDYGTIPKDCVRPWEANKKIQEGLSVATENKKFFPKLSSKNLKWQVVFYYPIKSNSKTLIPHIVKIKRKFEVGIKFQKLPVYNPFSRDFDWVSFRASKKTHKVSPIYSSSSANSANSPNNNKPPTSQFSAVRLNKVKLPEVIDQNDIISDSYDPNKEMEVPLFATCDEGMNMLQDEGSKTNAELVRQLKSRCNLDVGDKINGIPIIGTLTRGVSSFLSGVLQKGKTFKDLPRVDDAQIVM